MSNTRARICTLQAIEDHVVAHRFISFQLKGGKIVQRLNTGDRNSLDPKTRDLWAEYDELG